MRVQHQRLVVGLAWVLRAGGVLDDLRNPPQHPPASALSAAQQRAPPCRCPAADRRVSKGCRGCGGAMARVRARGRPTSAASTLAPKRLVPLWCLTSDGAVTRGALHHHQAVQVSSGKARLNSGVLRCRRRPLPLSSEDVSLEVGHETDGTATGHGTSRIEEATTPSVTLTASSTSHTPRSHSTRRLSTMAIAEPAEAHLLLTERDLSLVMRWHRRQVAQASRLADIAVVDPHGPQP